MLSCLNITDANVNYNEFKKIHWLILHTFAHEKINRNA